MLQNPLINLETGAKLYVLQVLGKGKRNVSNHLFYGELLFVVCEYCSAC